MSKRDLLIKNISILLSNRSTDYLLGHLDAYLSIHDNCSLDPVSHETLSIMVDVVESILLERGLIK